MLDGFRNSIWASCWLSMLVVFWISDSAHSQSSSKADREQLAKSHAKRLQSGILLIRLESQRNKINTLEQLKEKQSHKREYWDKKMEEAINDRNEYVLQLYSAIHDEFQVAEVGYLWDYETKQLREADTIFYRKHPFDQDLAFVECGRKDWYLLTDDNTGLSGPEHYRILDQELHLVPHPFPSKWRKNTSMGALLYGFGLRKSPEKNLRKLVKKMNQQISNLCIY